MNYLERIDTNPNVMLGKPVIKGTRMTAEGTLGMHPHLTHEDILAAVAS